MTKYIFRLDDACEKRNIDKWNRVENIFDKYGVKPLVGIIPCCKDSMMEKYAEDIKFWEKVHDWERKEWTIAMHV